MRIIVSYYFTSFFKSKERNLSLNAILSLLLSIILCHLGWVWVQLYIYIEVIVDFIKRIGIEAALFMSQSTDVSLVIKLLQGSHGCDHCDGLCK